MGLATWRLMFWTNVLMAAIAPNPHVGQMLATMMVRFVRSQDTARWYNSNYFASIKHRERGKVLHEDGKSQVNSCLRHHFIISPPMNTLYLNMVASEIRHDTTRHTIDTTPHILYLLNTSVPSIPYSIPSPPISQTSTTTSKMADTAKAQGTAHQQGAPGASGQEPPSGIQGKGTQNEPYDQGNQPEQAAGPGIEPPSGQTGPGTATKPYDQGNQPGELGCELMMFVGDE